jgi:hypothetical protein
MKSVLSEKLTARTARDYLKKSLLVKKLQNSLFIILSLFVDKIVNKLFSC